ncbi:hypothetical protein B0H13DRAFT_466622 [Mycena leptocephala]|nr:hypothetical protein B0H13DRAFT_466622 [Mycena leptocephala]
MNAGAASRTGHSSSSKKSSSVAAFPTGNLAINSAGGLSSLASFLVPSSSGLLLLVGAALYKRQKKKEEPSRTRTRTRTRPCKSAGRRGAWSRFDMASRGGSPFAPPLPLVISGGIDSRGRARPMAPTSPRPRRWVLQVFAESPPRPPSAMGTPTRP